MCGSRSNDKRSSAVDLFEGQALVWFRSTKGRILDWDQLRKELKIVFQPPDYDERLKKEIAMRTQGEFENIDIYLAIMENLYARLSTPVSEEEKLRQIKCNLNSHLQDKLCMFPVTSFKQLRDLGRKAEQGKRQSSNVQPPPHPRMTMEPDLAYNRLNSRQNLFQRQGNTWNMKKDQVSALNNEISRTPTNKFVSSDKKVSQTVNSSDDTSRQKRCWNCGKIGHTHVDCKQQKSGLFCYKCGYKNYNCHNCPRCNKVYQPKNVQQKSEL